MASGLIGAGLLSGLGQGLGQGLNDANRMYMYTELEKIRQSAEDMRNEKRIAAQAAHDKSVQDHDTFVRDREHAFIDKRDTTKFGQDIVKETLQQTAAKELKEKDVAANLTAHLLDASAAAGRQDSQQAFQRGENDLTRKAEKENLDIRIKSAEKIASESNTSHEKLSKNEIDARNALAYTMHGLKMRETKPIEQADGSMYLIDGNGNMTQVVTPEGKPFKGLHDLPTAVKAMIDIDKTMIAGIEHAKINPLLDDTQRAALNAREENLRKEVGYLTGLMTPPKPGETAPQVLTPDEQRAFIEQMKASKMSVTDLEGYLKGKNIDAGFLAPLRSSTAPTPVAPPASPSVGPTAPRATRSGGMINVAPNPLEEEMMRRSLEQ